MPDFRKQGRKRGAGRRGAGIIEILFTKGILDRNSYQENGILTSESIQKVWMEATKRRKRELSELPYLMVKLEKENGKADTPRHYKKFSNQSCSKRKKHLLTRKM